MPLISEVTHQMGLLPLLWLFALRGGGWNPDKISWGIAIAFAISWLADTAAHWIDPWLVSLVYPVLQAGLIAAMLRPAREVKMFLVMLAIAGIVATLNTRVRGPDVLLHTVAWLGIAVMVLRQRDRRWMPLLGFVGMWVCWLLYRGSPGWLSWGLFQSARAATMGGFCWAVTHAFYRLEFA